MGMKLFGAACPTTMVALARERGDGTLRTLMNGQVTLDPVKAWVTGARHIGGVSTHIEAYYEAVGVPSASQHERTLPARMAGIDTRLIVGRVIDIKLTATGHGLMMYVNGLRTPSGPGCLPFGQMTTKGLVIAMSIGCSLGVTIDEAIAIAGPAYIAEGRARIQAGRPMPLPSQP